MSILGVVVGIDSKSATIVLICVIALLVWLDAAIAEIEEIAHANGYHGIFHKVNKEMMILGLVSFSTFIVFEGLQLQADSVWYLSFEFAHILVLFIALSFVMQALLLTKFIANQRKRLYRLFYLSEELILSKYEILRQYKLNKFSPKLMNFFYHMFHRAPLWFPFPALRDAMEYKILEEHFIRSFLLPEQFHFAEYMSRRFKAYIFALVEVHPVSWFVLVVLVGLNYGRISLIDSHYQDEVCEQFIDHSSNSTNATSTGHRFLAAAAHAPVSTSPACDQYTLRVIFFYAMMLSVYIFIVFYYSNVYMQRHLNHAVRALLDPPQCRCEQHVPFQPQFDDYAEYRQTGHTRSLYRICMMNIVAVRRREKEITAMRTIMRLRANEEELRLAAKARLREEQEAAGWVGTGAGTVAGAGSVESVGGHTSSAASSSEDHGGAASSSDENSWLRIPMNGNNSFTSAHHSRSPSTPYFGLERGYATSQKSTPGYRRPYRDIDSDDDDYRTNASSSGTSDGSDSDDDADENGNGGSDYVMASQKAATARSGFLVRSSTRNFRNNDFNYGTSDFSSQSTSRGVTKPNPRLEAVREVPPNEVEFDADPDARPSSSAPPASRMSFRNSRGNSFVLPSSGTSGKLRPGSVSKRDSSFSKVKKQPGAGKHGGGHSSDSEGDRGRLSGKQMKRGSKPPPAAHQRTMSGRTSRANSNEIDPAIRRLAQASFRGHNLQTFYAEISKRLTSSDGHGTSGGGHVEGSGVGGSEDYRKGPAAPALGSTRLASELMAGATANSTEIAGIEFKLEHDTSHLFMWRSQWIYRLTLEIALLLQCFYIAVWCTNIFIITTETEHYGVLWFFALTLPMVINFFMLSSILFLSCTLEAVSMLNLKDSGAVCEKAIQSEEATDKFRTVFRSRLVEMSEIPRVDRRHYVREKLRELNYIDEDPDEDADDADSTGAATASARTTGYHITYAEFRKFLLEFHIFMSERSFLTLCHALDKQKSAAIQHSRKSNDEGSISVLYIYYVLFPEAAFKQQQRQTVAMANATSDTARSGATAIAAAKNASSSRTASPIKSSDSAKCHQVDSAQHEYHVAEAGDIKIHNRGSLNSEYLMFKKKPSDSRINLSGALARNLSSNGPPSSPTPTPKPAWENLFGVFPNGVSGLRSISLSSLDIEEGGGSGIDAAPVGDHRGVGAQTSAANAVAAAAAESAAMPGHHHKQPIWKKMFAHRGSGGFASLHKRRSLMDEVELVVDGSAFGASSTITGLSPEEAAAAEAAAAESELRASIIVPPIIAETDSPSSNIPKKIARHPSVENMSTIDMLAVTAVASGSNAVVTPKGSNSAPGSTKK